MDYDELIRDLQDDSVPADREMRGAAAWAISCLLRTTLSQADQLRLALRDAERNEQALLRAAERYDRLVYAIDQLIEHHRRAREEGDHE